ncbi:MAG: hypothetical protein QXO66_06960, partial [Thermofilum sp.]
PYRQENAISLPVFSSDGLNFPREKKGGMLPEDTWSRWPLMEEEILVVEGENEYTFSIPYQLLKKRGSKALKEAGVSYSVVEDVFGNKRVVFKTSKSKGLEVRAWLSVIVNQNSGYFITEIEEVEKPEQ